MLQQERSFDQHDHDNSSAIYNMTLDDSRLSIKTVYTSLTGIWLTTVTASLSALASMLLIFIIFRSTTKLGSIYHRILFGMSFYDIIESLAMALTTIRKLPKYRKLFQADTKTTQRRLQHASQRRQAMFSR
jgi:hypothetical protein